MDKNPDGLGVRWWPLTSRVNSQIAETALAAPFTQGYHIDTIGVGDVFGTDAFSRILEHTVSRPVNRQLMNRLQPDHEKSAAYKISWNWHIFIKEIVQYGMEHGLISKR